jgi:hypothetical protein
VLTVAPATTIRIVNRSGTWQKSRLKQTQRSSGSSIVAQHFLAGTALRFFQPTTTRRFRVGPVPTGRHAAGFGR